MTTFQTLLRRQHGMALLITLAVISLLIVVSLELNRRARANVYIAAAVRDRLTLAVMLDAGVNAAMAMLVEDARNSETDSLQEDWADPEKVAEVVRQLPFEEGELTVTISDERSRIQVNGLVDFPDGRSFNEKQRTLWERFLRLALLAHEHPEEDDPVNTIVNSLKDWMDSGDDDAISGLTGAESDYYRDRDPPYTCRNGPFTYLAELEQVRGFWPELLYGKGEIPGIAPYLSTAVMTETAEGRFTFDGRININTAEVPVLMALLPEESRDLALALSDYRMEKTGDTYVHNLSGATWYKEVPGAGDISIDPSLITTRTEFFRVEISAALGEMRSSAVALLKREKEAESDQIRCRILSWERT
jgi:general secretion pathway protein K